MRNGKPRILAVLTASALGLGVFAANSVAATIPLKTVGACCKFNKTTLTAKAGKVTITLTNTAGVPHNIAIKGKATGKVVTKGTSTASATLKKGTYTFLCTVPGHAASGMKGTLKVT